MYTFQPATLDALRTWQDNKDATGEAAAAALSVALPALRRTEPPTAHCPECPIQLAYEPGTTYAPGEGGLCVDYDGRGTVNLSGLPQTATGIAADLVFGDRWFDGTSGPLATEPPGHYYYDDELTSAEYAITIHRGGTADLHIAYVVVPDAAAVCDALAQTLRTIRLT